MANGRGRAPVLTYLAGLSAVLLLSACSPQIQRHGHIFTENEIQLIQPGLSKEQIQLSFGTPDTTSTIGGGVFYYISSTQKHVPIAKPRVVKRRVVAVYFNQNETVERVANYGLKDGKLFDFAKQETPSHSGDTSLLRQLLRNLGPGQVFSSDS